MPKPAVKVDKTFAMASSLTRDTVESLIDSVNAVRHGRDSRGPDLSELHDVLVEARARLENNSPHGNVLDSLPNLQFFRSELVHIIEMIQASSAFRRAADAILFFPLVKSRLVPLGLVEGQTYTIHDVLNILHYKVKDILGDSLPPRAKASLEDLVPSQKIGPARFDIVNGTLTVAKNTPRELQSKTHIIKSAKNAILELAEKIDQLLLETNLSPSLKDLHDKIGTAIKADNSIFAGIMNITYQQVIESTSDEISNDVLGRLRGEAISVNMYVSQFEEWRQFSEAAMTAELSSANISTILLTANNVLDELNKVDEVDESVPRVIIALRTLISDPKLASKRAAFAVLRTIENLTICIYQKLAEYFDKTTDKIISGGSSVTAKIVIAGLASVAIAAASGLAGVKLNELIWLKTASKLVENYIQSLF